MTSTNLNEYGMIIQTRSTSDHLHASLKSIQLGRTDEVYLSSTHVAWISLRSIISSRKAFDFSSLDACAPSFVVCLDFNACPPPSLRPVTFQCTCYRICCNFTARSPFYGSQFPTKILRVLIYVCAPPLGFLSLCRPGKLFSKTSYTNHEMHTFCAASSMYSISNS